MKLRRVIKNKLCTPMQLLKEMVRECGIIYRVLCWIEARIILGSHWIGIAKIISRDRFGSITKVEYAYNAQGLVNGGEQAMIDEFLAALNPPAGFQVRCFNCTVTETDTPATLTGEPSTNGYAPQTLARNTTDWPTGALDNGDWMRTSKTMTFGATGGPWGPVNTMCLITTDAIPRLISYYDISPKSPVDGESFDVIYSVKLS